MDDLIFSARRSAARGAARTRRACRTWKLVSRSLVQSPLRAGLLRYFSSRPDESFDVESLMQTFGRLKLDVENCVKELVDFGVARHGAGRLRRASWPSVRRRGDAPICSTTSSSARASGQHRRPVAVGAALPRDDRPRREDAGRLRVDPHRGQVGHLGADSRADRLGQGSRGAR